MSNLAKPVANEAELKNGAVAQLVQSASLAAMRSWVQIPSAPPYAKQNEILLLRREGVARAYYQVIVLSIYAIRFRS